VAPPGTVPDYGANRLSPISNRKASLYDDQPAIPVNSATVSQNARPTRRLVTPRTIDLAVGERRDGPILLRHDQQRLDRRTAHRWVRSIGKRAELGLVHPHMLRAAFIMAALDAGVPLREVQVAARHADPRTTTVYDRRRQDFERHAAYVVVAFVAGG
jgi:integrase